MLLLDIGSIKRGRRPRPIHGQSNAVHLTNQLPITNNKHIAVSKSTVNFASGGQKPFREKVSGLPKAFHWYGLDTLFFFVCVCG